MYSTGLLAMSAPGGGPPGDWLGLLKWSLKHQDGTTDNPELRDMSEDKRKWLEKVMQDSFVDVVKQLKESLDELEAIASEAASKEVRSFHISSSAHRSGSAKARCCALMVRASFTQLSRRSSASARVHILFASDMHSCSES